MFFSFDSAIAVVNVLDAFSGQLRDIFGFMVLFL
jgi:hypothetical protein